MANFETRTGVFREPVNSILICCFLLITHLIAHGQTYGNERSVRNVTAFSKLFGYVRYFHPADETQRIDWERFAVYGSEEVCHAANDQELLVILRQLFQPLAPSMKLFRTGEPISFDPAAITPSPLKGYQEISWQYTAMSMRLDRAYPRPERATVRINRSSWNLVPVVYDTTRYGMVFQVLPAMYNGGKFLLQAKMKVVAAKGTTAELGFANVAPSTGNAGSDYTTAAHGGKDSTWKLYQLSGMIDEASEQLYIGITLKGKGTAFVRDVHLSVVKDNQRYEIPVENTSFNQADEAGRPVAWVPIPFNNYEYQISHSGQPDAALKISDIDPTALNKKAEGPVFDYKARMGDYTRKELVPGITCIVPLVVYGNENTTYPVGDTAALQQLTNAVNRNVLQELSGDSLKLRLGDIVIAWNIYRHFYPFWQEAAVSPDEVLNIALHKSFTDKTAADFFQTIKQMAAALNDGHIFTDYDHDSSSYAIAPVVFTTVGEKLVIKDVLDTVLQTRIKMGDIVDSINGKTGMEALRETASFISGSPQGKRYMGLIYLGRGYPDTKLDMVLRRGDLSYKAITDLRREGVSSRHRLVAPPPASGSEIANGIYYINLLESPDQITPLIEKHKDAKAIIFDGRGYPSYDLFDIVLSHLITEKKGNPSLLYDPQIIYPDFQRVCYTLSEFWVQPKAPHLNGKIYFLSDAGIGSHPEYFLGFVKAYQLGTIIGMPTAGVDGTINGFSLPGGYHLTFTGVLVTNQQGNASHLQGILPDISVIPGMESISLGKDEILEQAIKTATQDAN